MCVQVSPSIVTLVTAILYGGFTKCFDPFGMLFLVGAMLRVVVIIILDDVYFLLC